MKQRLTESPSNSSDNGRDIYIVRISQLKIKQEDR
jgi:hypothetical protein